MRVRDTENYTELFESRPNFADVAQLIVPDNYERWLRMVGAGYRIIR
jgi:hypothetical protein